MKRTSTLIVILSIIGIANMAKAQEVKLNTNLAIEADGTMRMDAGAMVWDDLRVTLDNGSSAAVLDYFIGTSGPQIWYFRWDASVEAMSFTVQLPHNWKEGTKIFPHLHWSPDGNGTGNIEWNFEYSWQNYTTPTPSVFPPINPNVVISTGPFTANTHNITALTVDNVGLDATGKKISSILVCRIWRNGSNANDTFNQDAGLLFLDFHYQLDTFGSREEYVK